MSITTSLPWHQSTWKQLYHAAQLNKLPHALLVQAPSGSGKWLFAKGFAQTVLCSKRVLDENKIYRGCDHCRSCVWFLANTHPNYYEVTPTDSKKPAILIDSIRHLMNLLDKTPFHTDSSQSINYHTIVVIHPTESLHTAATHALLKTLEEPLPGVLFLLLSAQSQSLPMTLRSRCQKITLPFATLCEALPWVRTTLQASNVEITEEEMLLSLQLNNELPIRAAQAIQNHQLEVYQSIFEGFKQLCLRVTHPGAVAQAWSQHAIDSVLACLRLILFECVQRKLDIPSSYQTRFTVLIQQLLPWISETSIKQLFTYWDLVQQNQAEAFQHNLNPLLLMENLAYQVNVDQ